MKNFTKKELYAIYSGLNNGVMYSLVKNGYCHGRITADNDYIHYQIHGSSAIKNTVAGLEWLLKDLYKDFDDITPAVYSMEIFNPVDLTGRYKSIDISRYHKEMPESIYYGEFYYEWYELEEIINKH